VKYFLTFANDGSGDVDGKVLSPQLRNSSLYPQFPADACICQDDFTPKLFENYPSREKALEMLQQSCRCVDCYDDSTFAVCAFFVEEVYDTGLLHFQTYDDRTNSQRMLMRRKRNILKRFFDRIGGGISLKHNQESRADVNIGINEDNRSTGSGNLSSTPDSKVPTTTAKPA
jgi:hypothetical protein